MNENEFKVIGLGKVDFETRDGNRIIGYSVFVTFHRSGVDGLAAEKFFISDSKFSASPFKLGDIVEIFFNRYGKVNSIVPVK